MQQAGGAFQRKKFRKSRCQFCPHSTLKLGGQGGSLVSTMHKTSVIIGTFVFVHVCLELAKFLPPSVWNCLGMRTYYWVVKGVACHGCLSELHGNVMRDWLYAVVRSGCFSRLARTAGQGCPTGLLNKVGRQGCSTGLFAEVVCQACIAKPCVRV